MSDKEIMESFFGAAVAAPKPFPASAAGKAIYERFLQDLCPAKLALEWDVNESNQAIYSFILLTTSLIV